MKFIQKQTDQELKKLAVELHSSIYQTECFGTNDLIVYQLACRELEKRGYLLNENKKLSIKKGN